MPKVSVAVIMLFQVSALFVRELARRELLQSGTPADIADYQSAWAGFSMLAVLMWPYLRDHRNYLVSVFQQPGSWPRLVLTSIAIGLTMRAASWGVSYATVTLTPGNLPGNWVSPKSGLQWNCPELEFILLAIATSVIAIPIIEEVINRGFILGAFTRVSQKYSSIVSASLFAVLHRPDSMLAAFLFGIAVAIQMQHCHSLWGPIIAHAAFNFLTIVENHCVTYFDLEELLLALPREQLAMLAVFSTVACYFVCIRFARWSGAGTK
ncbi:MAG: CPBP family intramembrane glutamic endopeptidase [Woeseiaceae bacterium]